MVSHPQLNTKQVLQSTELKNKLYPAMDRRASGVILFKNVFVDDNIQGIKNIKSNTEVQYDTQVSK